MNPFSSSPNLEFVRRRLQALVQSSSLPLTNSRRLALLESCRQATDGAELLDMTLEALGESTAIPDALKDKVMNGLLTGDWEGVQRMVNASATQSPHRVGGAMDDPFLAFRRMAITIFYASRKIQHLPLVARRRLGSSILRTTNREELMHLFLTNLVHASTLDNEARLKIANDVLEGRFYRLLLPDRFDCEDPGATHSLQSSTPLANDDSNSNDGIRVSCGETIPLEVEHVWIDESTQDCPICLGYVQNPMTLHCQHVFCRDCILDWANESAGPTVTRRRGHHQRQQQVACPICRQSNDLPMSVQDAQPSSPRVSAYLPDWNVFNVRF